jgi:hypothetical protein
LPTIHLWTNFVVLKNDEFVVKKPEEAARMEGSPGSVNEVVDTAESARDDTTDDRQR